MHQLGFNPARTRMERLSNEDSNFNGCATGKWLSNNMRSMGNHACTVANFRHFPTTYEQFDVDVSGPNTACLFQQEEWTVDIEDDESQNNVYNYIWEKSQNGITDWCPIGNNDHVDNLELLTNCWMEGEFYLRVTVWNVWEPNITEVSQVMITFVECIDGDDSSSQRNNNSVTSEIKVYPNPFTEYVHLKGIDEVKELINASGQSINFQFEEGLNEGRIALSHLPNGAYWIKTSTKGVITTTKIIKQ